MCLRTCSPVVEMATFELALLSCRGPHSPLWCQLVGQVATGALPASLLGSSTLSVMTDYGICHIQSSPCLGWDLCRPLCKTMGVWSLSCPCLREQSLFGEGGAQGGPCDILPIGVYISMQLGQNDSDPDINHFVASFCSMWKMTISPTEGICQDTWLSDY